jgi:signal transduction histidine kinase
VESQKTITLSEEAKEQIRKGTEEYRVLHNVAKALQSTEGTKKMLQEAMKAIVEYGELQVEYKAGIFLVDEENRVLNLFTWVGEFSDEFLESEKVVPYGECLCGRAAASGEMIISNNCFSDKRHDNIFEDMKAHGHYIVPLKSRNKLVGILFLYTDPDPPWFERSQEILLSMGSLIADAIEQRKAEEQIRTKNKELHELNDLKNKFLGIASHDLRNPLYLIRSFSEILIGESIGKVNEKQKRLLEKIFNSSEFMRALLENLLDISKIESGTIELEKTVQDINEITKKQMELFELLAEKKNTKLHLEMEKIPPFAFDKNAVIQAIGNYIGNAIKFSPENINIYISTEIEDNKLKFSVRDEGPGISQADQKLLFGEFQTLSAKPTGGEKSTGLGLAIVKKLIKLHGGEVGVSSELGAGSTFFFTLPLD